MTTLTMTYSKDDLLVARAAREVRDGDVVFVGIGIPNRAANLAKQAHAPGARLIYESGVYGAAPSRWPQSIGDPCLVVNSLAVHSMAELFLYYLQGGLIDVGFLGAAQIDRFANLNTTVVGEYARPTVRLPGSGGACDIAVLTRKLVITIPQSLRHFPPRIDFITSPGLRDRAGRVHDRQGLSPTRSMVIITDMAVFGMDPGDSEMVVRSLHPGVTLEALRAHMGWEPRVSARVETTVPPTEAELAIIRQHVLVA